jgi:AmmeMemoRadiSam system protein A
LARLLASKQVEMCGGGLAVAVTKAAIKKGANRAKLLRYGDSGDVSGDKQAVVGYAAIVLYRTDVPAETNRGNPSDKREVDVNSEEPYQLSDMEKTFLLQTARRSINEYLVTGKVSEPEPPDKLREPGAAFVTLEKEGHLRGCIGYTQAVEPLHRTVAQCAVKAATEDYRFRPVTKNELAECHIEISVLTPLQEVESLDEIQVGRDGLMIVMGRLRGLLLPQVAVEQGWDRDTFLEHTCRKAGLPPDAYKSPESVLYRFQALIFGE